MVGKKGYLERFCGETVPGGQRGDATWNAFAGIPCQVGRGKEHLEHFRGKTVAGGRQGDATCHAFAGIPCQVGGRKCYLPRFCGNTVAGGRQRRTPGTLSREYRGRWEAGKDTWHSHSKCKITVRVTESLTAGSHGAKGLLWTD